MIIEFLIWLVIFQSAQNVYVCSGVLFTKIKFINFLHLFTYLSIFDAEFTREVLQRGRMDQ